MRDAVEVQVRYVQDDGEALWVVVGEADRAILVRLFERAVRGEHAVPGVADGAHGFVRHDEDAGLVFWVEKKPRVAVSVEVRNLRFRRSGF